VGWNFQAKGVPESEVMSKKEFLWEQGKWIVIIVLYQDASSIHLKGHFYGGKPDPVNMPSLDIR
jgi:hypothetical protein